MAKNYSSKKKIIQEIKNQALKSNSAIIANYSGIKANQMNYLREKARQSNIYIKVIQNNLAKIAIKDTIFECMEKEFAGPLLIALTKDPSLIAKLLNKFRKKNEMLILKKIFFENKLFGKNKIMELAQLPSKKESIVMLYVIIQEPLRQFIGIIQEIPMQLINILTQIYKNNQKQ